MDFSQLIFRYKKEFMFFLIGIALLLVGVLLIKGGIFEENKVEILNQSNSNNNKDGQIVVEIAGAVQKAGVYKLSSDSRIEDLLVAAGGITQEADELWIERFINRAAKLSDGQKIYIPTQNEQSNITKDNNSQVNTLGLININTASQKELESLWGVGPVTAQSIIEGRPYSSIEELLTKKILKKNVYEANKDKLTIY